MFIPLYKGVMPHKLLLLFALLSIDGFGSTSWMFATAQQTLPIERIGSEIVVIKPLEQPIVLQSMMNTSVSELVFAIPYFRLVPSAWTYITVDTPYVLSRDFVISSTSQPPTVVDYAWIANKIVLDRATFTYKNLVLVNARKFDLFGLDWILNSKGSQLSLQNVTLLDPLCIATAKDVLQVVGSLPNMPGVPPNSVSILPAEHCVPAFPEAPGDSAAAAGQFCFSQPVHFKQLHLRHDDVGSGTGSRASYVISMQNVTRVCKAHIDKRCLQEHHNTTFCWNLQAAHMLGVQHLSQQDSTGGSNTAGNHLDKGAIAGIAIGCAAAAVLLAAVGYYCLLRSLRAAQPEALLVTSSAASGSHHSNASTSVKSRGASGVGGGNSFVAAQQSTLTVVHDSYWSMEPNCNDNAKNGNQHLLSAKCVQQHRDITLGVLLGAGSFGRVYKGRWQGGDVAIKVIHCLPQEVNRVLREAEILMGVQHDHIVRCFKCCVVQSDREAAFQPGRMDDNISDQASSATAVHSNKSLDTVAAAVHPGLLHQHSNISRYADSTETASMSTSAAATTANAGSGTAAPGPHWVELQELSAAVEDPELDQVAQGSESQVWLVLELCNGGNLQDSNSEPKTRFDMARLICRLHEVALGMDYLHAHGIMHGDLKAANVLLKNTIYGRYGQIAKLSDFGLANILTDGATHRSTGRMGTITHQAPEVLERGHVSPSADVYSFGIMMWELFTGTLAFKNLHYGAVVQRVVVAGQRPPIPEVAPEEYCLLMTRCWDVSPHARPTFKQIAECLQLMLDSQDSSTMELRRAPSALQLFSSPRPDDALQKSGPPDEVASVHVELTSALPWPAAASIPVPSRAVVQAGSMHLGSPAGASLSPAVSDAQHSSLGRGGFAAREDRAMAKSPPGPADDSSAFGSAGRGSGASVLLGPDSSCGGPWLSQASASDTVAELAGGRSYCSSTAGALRTPPATATRPPCLRAEGLSTTSVAAEDSSQRRGLQPLSTSHHVQDPQQQVQSQQKLPPRLLSLEPMMHSDHVKDL